MSAEQLLREVAVELGYTGARGYVDEPESAGPRALVWADLQDKCGVTAAYFKGAVPVVAFVATQSRDEAMVAHRRLWNYGRVPILIATTSEEILAISCNIAPTRKGREAAVLEVVSAHLQASVVLADFTRFSVESGNLTKQRSKQLATHNRVDHLLLRNLRALRGRLLAAGVLKNEIEPLLGRSIFVKYLEDRKILLAHDLEQLGQPPSLVAALTAGWDSVSSFFGAMSEHFNGDVFQADSLERAIPSDALNVLAHFFEGGDVETGQTSLWPYDFAIIPPELISSIYEQLLAEQQKSDAAYYTPRRIVDLVLDELLPAEGSPEPPTVLDPACGSGIFLTESFRRLVRHRKASHATTPGYEELSSLLVSSIFGVDQSADAIGVTAFGLYLALLEHVDPRTVWREVKLPGLVGTNLVVSDFFAENSLSARRFDVIVGNPPWQSKLSAAAAAYLHQNGRQAPDRQIAVAFIWKCSQMLAPKGAAGLVLPAKTILHNRGSAADRFRLELFSSLSVQTVVDLSPLRRELFGATSPAAIAIYQSDPDETSADVLHVSPRRTPISEIIDGIAIPQHRIQRVPRARTRTDPAIWKPLLWGSTQDLALVTHLRETFGSFSSLAKARKWSMGAGFQDFKNGDHNDARHLHDLPQIATSDLRTLRAPDELLAPVEAVTMHRPRDRSIYLAPHILMRKGFAKAPESAFVPYDATFTDGLFAVAGDSADESLLKAVSAILASSVAQYWYFMTSSSWGVEREQLHYREWLSLPLPKLDEPLVAELTKVVESAETGIAESVWRPALDGMVEAAYELTDLERQTAHDALDVTLSELRYGSGSPAYDPPSMAQFDEYTRGLARNLNSLEIGEWDVAYSESVNGFARVVCVSDGASLRSGPSAFSLDRLARGDSEILEEGLTSRTIVEPEAIILDGDRIHVVKPNRRSCWLESAALRDASAVFEALVKGGSARDV